METFVYIVLEVCGEYEDTSVEVVAACPDRANALAIVSKLEKEYAENQKQAEKCEQCMTYGMKPCYKESEYHTCDNFTYYRDNTYYSIIKQPITTIEEWG